MNLNPHLSSTHTNTHTHTHPQPIPTPPSSPPLHPYRYSEGTWPSTPLIHSLDPRSLPLASPGRLLFLHNTRCPPLSCCGLTCIATAHHPSNILTQDRDTAAQSADGGPQPPTLRPQPRGCCSCNKHTHSTSAPPPFQSHSLHPIHPTYSLKIESLQPSQQTEGLSHRRSALSPEVVAAAAPTHTPHSAFLPTLPQALQPFQAPSHHHTSLTTPHTPSTTPQASPHPYFPPTTTHSRSR